MDIYMLIVAMACQLLMAAGVGVVSYTLIECVIPRLLRRGAWWSVYLCGFLVLLVSGNAVGAMAFAMFCGVILGSDVNLVPVQRRVMARVKMVTWRERGR